MNFIIIIIIIIKLFIYLFSIPEIHQSGYRTYHL